MNGVHYLNTYASISFLVNLNLVSSYHTCRESEETLYQCPIAYKSSQKILIISPAVDKHQVFYDPPSLYHCCAA